MTPDPTSRTSEKNSEASLKSANGTNNNSKDAKFTVKNGTGSSCSEDESSRSSTPNSSSTTTTNNNAVDCEIPNEMLKEVQVASEFLTQLVKQRFGDEIALKFEGQLQPRMVAFYNGHWFPKTPYRGMAYRCMRFNVWEIDPLVLAAANASGLTTKDLRMIFPAEFALWVDPGEVSYRIGEEGSVCELYTLADGCRQKPSAAASMIRGISSFGGGWSSPRKPYRSGAGAGEATSGYQITNNANPRHNHHNNNNGNHHHHHHQHHHHHNPQPYHVMNNANNMKNNQAAPYQRFSFGGGANVRRSFNPSFHQQQQSPPRIGSNHSPPATNAYFYQQHPPPPPPPPPPQNPQQQQQRPHYNNFRSSPDHQNQQQHNLHFQQQQFEKNRPGISSWLSGACKENLERLLDMNWPEISAAASS